MFRNRRASLTRGLLLPLSITVLTLLASAYASHSSAASKGPAKIGLLGTDDQLYTCSGDCAKTDCITCPVKGLSVERDDGIRKVGLREVQLPGMPQLPGPPGGDEDRPRRMPSKHY